MEGRPNWRNKATLSNISGVVWTGPGEKPDEEPLLALLARAFFFGLYCNMELLVTNEEIHPDRTWKEPKERSKSRFLPSRRSDSFSSI